jgi:hypothetical protein
VYLFLVWESRCEKEKWLPRNKNKIKKNETPIIGIFSFLKVLIDLKKQCNDIVLEIK